jgi:hypothetical protein
MDDILTEPGAFAHGVLHQGRYYKSFVLEEDTMRHALLVSNDHTLDFRRLAGDEAKGIPSDDAYYSACILAKRLKVDGVANTTPEQVLNLSRQDGQLLLGLSARLEQRRELFRSEAAAAAQGPAGDAEARLRPGGDSLDEPGADPQL